MSFIKGPHGPESDYWAIGDVSSVRQFMIAFHQWHGIGPKPKLHGPGNVAYYRTDDDPLFDLIFVPEVIANWRSAKTDIDSLIRLWTDESDRPTGYEHWFVDEAYFDDFAHGMQERIRRVYSLCRVVSADPDQAFRAMVRDLRAKTYDRALDIVSEVDGALDKNNESKEDAVKRLRYLAPLLGKPDVEALITYYLAS